MTVVAILLGAYALSGFSFFLGLLQRRPALRRAVPLSLVSKQAPVGPSALVA